ncbi:MAG TPA: VOC family protein [Candidatus Saccharimonadales bacterium]|nr:VOC family protein [Candidatus Saccharimonadales bacterium]
MKIKHVDHVGIVVQDLEAAKAFFVDLGFTVMAEMPIQGEWVERIIGLSDVSEDIAMLEAPDGQLNLELVKFHRPVDPAGIQPGHANTLGLRHLAFQVEDIDELVGTLKQKGHELVGEVRTYENMWRLCYVRGPESIIIELAERL